MTKITKEYDNVNNGGKERVSRDGDEYTVSSYHESLGGWFATKKVTREQMERCLAHSYAPEEVRTAIMA